MDRLLFHLLTSPPITPFTDSKNRSQNTDFQKKNGLKAVG
ncbi:hypothetical protein A45J_0863 [hot springs metagenome]|uniref:Uncharacterized protein n=1 Tax=hot springs metagenome TaxID=433727 RepID=A0A5J4L2P0_9ZZZZ